MISVGYSGKDSFCVVHCAIEALKEAMKINPNVGPLYINTVDTTIDNFEIMDFLREGHREIDDYAKQYKLPIFTKILKPKVTSRPIVQYIGRGLLLLTFETQSNGRQCTSDWKIAPTKTFLASLKEQHKTHKVLSLSGSRDDESKARKTNLS